MSAPTTNTFWNQTTPVVPSGDQSCVIQSDNATPQDSRTIYPKRMVGDTGSGGLAGTVPPPPAGSAAAGKFLKADGTFAVPSAGGLANIVATVAALRALAVPVAAVSTVVEGYYATQDGGGGGFIWDTASTASDDGGTIILPTGYGGTGRWRRLYSGAVFAKWFGAKGDGSTDDSSAIQAAINVAAANWGKISFDASVYLCTNLQVSTDKIILSGHDGTVLRNYAGSHSILTINSNRCGVEYIEFDGNKGSIGGTNANVLIYGAYNSIIRCRFYNGTDQGLCLDGSSTTCSNNTVRNCESYSNNGIGLSNNKVTDSDFGDNFIYSNGLEGLTFDGGSHRCSAIGNRIDGNCSSSGVGNIGVDGSDDCRVIGNTITNCGAGLAGIKTQNNGAAVNRLIVTGNSITSNGSAGGVWLHNGTGGIASACVVAGNDIYNNGSLSIVVDSGCTNNMIAGNNLNGVAVSDSGTGTTIIQAAGATYSAGSGLTLTGSTFSLTSPVAASSLGLMTGDSGSGGAKGAAPAPGAGDAAAGKFLKADATWGVPPGTGGGSVTSVSGTAPISSSGGATPAISVAAATTSTLGVVQPDGTSIGILAGVISVLGGGGGTGGRLLNVQRITATGSYTYTPTAGANSVVIELQGAGGGGSGVASPTGSNVNLGAGGASGGWLRVRLTANFSGATGSVGAKGTGGAAGNNNGNNGGNTTFIPTAGTPVTYTAQGGVGGTHNGAFAPPFIAGVAITSTATTGGDDSRSSQAGSVPIAVSINNNIGGSGGDCNYSPGAYANTLGGTNTSQAGTNADGKGGGGAGAVATGSGSAVAGGNGSDGIVIIWEFS